MTDETATAQDFLSEQLELLAAGDTAALAERYAPDAVLVRFDRVARGRAEIREFFDEFIKERPTVEAMDGVRVEDDVILYQCAERAGGRLSTAVGTLVFVDGLVWRQTAAFVGHRPEP